MFPVSPKLLAGVFAACALLMTTRLQADPYFHHSGGVCRPATSADAGRVQYQTSYGIRNDGTSTSRVHCPVDHDNTGKVPWGVFVAVIDRHPTANINCRLYIFNEGGGLLSQYSLNSDPFYGPDEAQQLTFYPMNHGANVFYNLRCDLPAKSTNGASHILTYQLLQ